MKTRTTKPRWGYVRVRSDARFRSQLRYLQTVTALALDEHAPSVSLLVRRSIGRLIEHYEDILEAGRLEGMKGPHEQDVRAEREALAEYGKIADAPPPKFLVDDHGAIRAWGEVVANPEIA